MALLRSQGAALAMIFQLISLIIAPFTYGFVSSQTERNSSPDVTHQSMNYLSRSAVTDMEPLSLRDSPLSYSISELGSLLGGQGRARILWDWYRQGADPLEPQSEVLVDEQPGHKLGEKTKQRLSELFQDSLSNKVASLVEKTVSSDGTTKMLLKLTDNLQVETVIIPWEDRKRSTVCVSSQVGCRQACTFCLTGRMGKLRNLSSDEILAQVWWAQQVCRADVDTLFPIDNIVFMGMGEPADNAEEVVRAAKVLADPLQFQLTPRRITISTVGPSPKAFADLSEAPAVLAWSVHASREDIRRELVPTTRHSMMELRQGLIDTLQNRPSRRLRATMLEIALIGQVNDSKEDALDLVDFCRPLMDRSSIPGVKLVVNLIPWNDIQVSLGPAAGYSSPRRDRVVSFQRVLQDAGIQCHIRTTRGDDELAACGQLATTEKAKK